MPKITAPTVAEHRTRRYAELLEAARQIVLADGPEAVTPGAVGARIGLARSSVYKYFPTSRDILVHLLEEIFQRWIARLGEVMAAQAGPAERVTAYIRTFLEFAGSEEHRVADAIGFPNLPPQDAARIRVLHRRLTEPLRQALVELGDPSPQITMELMVGTLNAATRLIAQGHPEAQITAATLAFVRPPGTCGRPGR
ncbi:TetR/AcrR family transcriptional regulator [Thermomonospora catenispora]|uniref:TetR/AcrR family transcriptional regulator n=1 Tax=Thermomonospora catenispora TaxID=2493090 RepID=UPI00111DD5A6|nr:TetR/AcrR family transcriptional regulator [Thermomonospora catenispora]TNY36608.1 TetR/AcrR family transcriptional regulator [Thermomonospora catenispora]